MHDKEWHRDRIAELELERQDYRDYRRVIPASMLGFIALFIGIFAIYFKDMEKYAVEIFVALLLTLLIIIILALIDNLLSKKEKVIFRRIRHNYDVLLDRKGPNNIVFIDEMDREKKTLEFIEQARKLNQIQGLLPAHPPDLYIHFNLIMAELSLKALCIYYLGKYEKTHYFGNVRVLEELMSHINPSEELKKEIKNYKKFSKRYYTASRYGETELTFYSKEQDRIEKTSKVIYMFMSETLYKLIKEHRDKILKHFHDESSPK